MKKVFSVIMLFVLFGSSTSVFALERKGTFRVGAYMPGFFIGSKHINTMISFGADGEYYFLEKLSANLRVEEATDFKAGDPPHSVLNFVARARYVFDIGDSGRWMAYVQGGGGGALIGSSHGAGDIAIPGGGFWYQWRDKWSFGFDSSLHILVRDETAVAFDMTPVIRYQF